ncbi:hypothetical protein R1flu_021989 [Riccia fluitans]|uniref:Uncharacterized protein n=1 Tax=Riccia fluitans TaxID=41844 RepID=A0ABD1ZSI7_9MARC
MVQGNPSSSNTVARLHEDSQQEATGVEERSSDQSERHLWVYTRVRKEAQRELLRLKGSSGGKSSCTINERLRVDDNILRRHKLKGVL